MSVSFEVELLISDGLKPLEFLLELPQLVMIIVIPA